MLLNSRNFTNIVKTYYESRLKRILQNPELSISDKFDNNKIMQQIMLNYAFRIVRLIIIILTISYFIGTLWYIFTRRDSKVNYDIDESDNDSTFYFRYM